MKIWEIDKALTLCEVSDLPSTADLIRCPEESIDTLLLRNLSLIADEFFGCECKFIFCSPEYWGSYDVVFQLSNGVMVCFENKSSKFPKEGYGKFLRDIEKVESEGPPYFEMRFDHIMQNVQRHMTCSIRMFAGFFLGIRSTSEPSSRDLATECQDALGIDASDFADLFESGNGWLQPFETSTSLKEYLGKQLYGSLGAEPQHVFFVPTSCVNKVQNWQAEFDNAPPNALLGSYEFYSCNGLYPTHLTTNSPTAFVC